MRPDGGIVVRDAEPETGFYFDGGDFENCPGFTPLATPEDLAASPRGNLEIERLALATGDTFTADQTIYDRLLVDVPLIRAMAPEVADIEHRPLFDRSLLITTDYAVTDSMESGEYTAWNCLNDYYIATAIDFERLSLSFDMVHVRFDGIYDLAALVDQYALLPDLNSVSPNWRGGDGSTICVTIEGDVYHYIFERGLGDCPEGCTAHIYTYFYTSASGATPVLAGEWDDVSRGPQPPWASQLTPCYGP